LNVVSYWVEDSSEHGIEVSEYVYPKAVNLCGVRCLGYVEGALRKRDE
jgi:hypothetical protein